MTTCGEWFHHDSMNRLRRWPFTATVALLVASQPLLATEQDLTDRITGTAFLQSDDGRTESNEPQNTERAKAFWTGFWLGAGSELAFESLGLLAGGFAFVPFFTVAGGLAGTIVATGNADCCK